MQTKLNKILSLLTAMLLVVTVAMPTISYATEEIETTKTSQENVEFDVNINGGKEATLNLSEKSKIDVNINVLNTGYIKEASLTVENNNYVVTESDSQYINKIEDNVITLNQINAGESASIELPIEFNKTEKVNPELFSRESTITLNAVYVNEAGKEKKIEKSYTLKVNWTKDDAEGIISQSLVRYLAYDTNKTMLSFEVVAGVKDNTIPATAEQIEIQVPKINNNLPTDVIVTGDEGNHTYQDGVLTITNENKVDENNELVWDSEKTYMVTYIYNSEASLGVLTQNATAKITTITGAELTAEPEQKDFAVESTVGSIVEFKEEGTDTLSKGYLLSNLKKEEDKSETNYSEKYIINVGLSSVTDKINVDEGESTFVNADGKTVISATDKILNKKISIDKDELVKLLGDEGRITVIGADGNEIGKLTSSTTSLDLGDTNKISLETSKPVTEGNITLNIDKAIASDIGLNEEKIKSITELKSNVTINGSMSDTVVSTKNVEKTITLTNPTSKVGISVNKDSLSTVEENKNVIISIILKTNTIDDALFENPTFHIQLPDEVKSMRVTEAQVLYDDELKAGTINGTANTIDLTVTGKQTKYASSTITDGALIRITANLTLDETAPSDTKSISVSYVNNATGETGESSQNIQIVAPSDFVTTNTVTVGDQTQTAVGDENTTIKVDDDAKEQDVEVTQTIVNNLGEDANGVTILGVLPAAGNKTVEGEDLQSTTTASLTSAVNVEGQDDAKVYYSTNNNEDINSSNWTENYTSDAKSYKVTTSSPVAAKKALKVRYAVKLASNLGYDQSTSETYGVYYNNESDQGVKTNLVAAKSVTLKTASAPNVTMAVSAVDTNAGYAISENGTVTTGEYVTYNVKVTNNGTDDQTNVKVTATLPDGIEFVEHSNASVATKYDTYYTTTDTTKTQTISKLGAGKSEVVGFDAKITRFYYEDTSDNSGLTDEEKAAKQAEIEASRILSPSFTLSSDTEEATSKTYSNKLARGTLQMKLTSNLRDENVEKDETFNALIKLENLSLQEQDNTKISVKLPAGIEYTGTTDDQYSYDTTNNIVTINVGNMTTDLSTYILALKVTTSDKGTLKISATATSDQTSEVSSNTITLNRNSGAEGIEAKQTTSLPNNTGSDRDKFVVYTTITNNSGSAQTFNYNLDLTALLGASSYTLTVGDESTTQECTNQITINNIEIEDGEKAQIAINVYKSSFDTLQNGESESYEIAPTLKLTNGTEVSLNSVTVTLNGTGYSSGTSDNSSTSDENASSDNNSTNGSSSNANMKYTIAGIAFVDANNNGKMDDDENRLSGLTITLYNSTTGEIVKDSNGNDLTTTTASDGSYTFPNLTTGNYNVIAKYDTSVYGVGLYKYSGAEEEVNNDFIETKLNDETVAASNTITLSKNEYNVNLGLISKETFDLRLDKKISKITVVNPQNGNKTYNYESNLAKVELSPKNVENNTILVEYKLTVTNEGKVAGYAKSIVDYIPSGLTFNSEINPTWYTKDENAYNQTLANTLINPGESKEVTLVLTRKFNGQNTGSFNNIAEIAESYNEMSIKDIDSTAGNKQNGEDDQSSAVAVILMSTGRTIMSVTGLTVIILAGIALAVYFIKKKIVGPNIRKGGI